ncbi:MAG: nitrous oxide reductase accessory protein NosL [Cyclobacteriaceae bacterium]|nr:nitrous oxide reductase accessory protein NosL [Cyclobacteriaceae bacterium]
MKNLIMYLSLSLLLMACKVEPEPIQFGKDACHHCKMIIMDPKFGAELVTDKGKIYKFDDVNCMVYHMIQEEREQFAHVMIVDFAKTHQLIDAKEAWFLHSDALRSPMASYIAAFENKADLEIQSRDFPGAFLRWTEVVNSFK